MSEETGESALAIPIEKPRYAKTLSNAVALLRYHWGKILTYNEFNHRVMLLGEPPGKHLVADRWKGYWTDEHSIMAAVWLGHNHDLHLSTAVVREAVYVVARGNKRHPVRDWLREAEGKWDGVGRLDRWLVDYAGVKDTAVSRTVFAKWMISAVARVFEPGCQADHVLILEGKQGAGKSSFFNILGGEWYSPLESELGSKDSIQALFSKWIVELPELTAIRRAADVERVKSFVTTRVDHIRVAYGRDSRDYPRQCILGGSTNDPQWMHDDAGRRWWPVEVDHDILRRNLNRLKEEREQLWGEAAARYTKGEKWYIEDEDTLQELAADVADRRVNDEWEPLLRKHLRTTPREKVTVNELLQVVLGISPAAASRSEQVRIGIAMAALGWQRKRLSDKNGDRYWAYVRPVDWRIGPISPGTVTTLDTEMVQSISPALTPT